MQSRWRAAHTHTHTRQISSRCHADAFTCRHTDMGAGCEIKRRWVTSIHPTSPRNLCAAGSVPASATPLPVSFTPPPPPPPPFIGALSTDGRLSYTMQQFCHYTVLSVFPLNDTLCEPFTATPTNKKTWAERTMSSPNSHFRSNGGRKTPWIIQSVCSLLLNRTVPGRTSFSHMRGKHPHYWMLSEYIFFSPPLWAAAQQDHPWCEKSVTTSRGVNNSGSRYVSSFAPVRAVIDLKMTGCERRLRNA